MLVKDIYFDTPVLQVVFIVFGDAASFGPDQAGCDAVFISDQPGHLAGSFFGEVFIVGFGALVVGVTCYQHFPDPRPVEGVPAAFIEDLRVFDPVVIEFKDDIIDPEGIDRRGRRLGGDGAGGNGDGAGWGDAAGESDGAGLPGSAIRSLV